MTSGYVDEIFSSFQGEGAAIEGSCYGLRQIFVRFSGCPLALGVHQTKGCVWCDSPRAKSKKSKFCLIEAQAGSQKFNRINNPITANELLEIVKKLKTPDLHSISLTGGEPLYQPEFLKEFLTLLKENNFITYLETAWTDDFYFLREISKFIDFACVDVKDRSANAAKDWAKLVDEEVEMCNTLAKSKNTKVFAKVVVSKATKTEDIHYITKKCGEADIPLVIQVLSPVEHNSLEPPSWQQIQEFTAIAAKYLPPTKIGLSVQVHKLINIL